MCESQVLSPWLALLQFCVHVADYKSEVGKNIPNCGNQVIAIGPENLPNPPVGSLPFIDQFIPEVMPFSRQTLDFRFHVRNPRCIDQGPFLGGVPIQGLVQTRWRLWYATRIRLMDFAKEGPEPTQEVGGFWE